MYINIVKYKCSIFRTKCRQLRYFLIGNIEAAVKFEAQESNHLNSLARPNKLFCRIFMC